MSQAAPSLFSGDPDIGGTVEDLCGENGILLVVTQLIIRDDDDLDDPDVLWNVEMFVPSTSQSDAVLASINEDFSTANIRLLARRLMEFLAKLDSGERTGP